MSDRYALLLVKARGDQSPILEIVDGLARIGVYLEYPGTNSVKVLDDAGIQRSYDRADLSKLLNEQHKITFQFWWNDSEDTCCRISATNGLLACEFWLDGLDAQQETLLLSSLGSYTSRFPRRTAPSVLSWIGPEIRCYIRGVGLLLELLIFLAIIRMS